MADYWQSNPRKYCEFCCCWYADNRISRELHESGNRHKGNVAKRLRGIQADETIKQKEHLEMSATLAEMERAAVTAYHEDLCSNPSLALSYGNAPISTSKVQVLPESLSSTKNTAIGNRLGWTEHVNIENKTLYCHAGTGRVLFKKSTKNPSATQKEGIAKQQDKAKYASRPIGEWQPVVRDEPSGESIDVGHVMGLPRPAVARHTALADELFESSDEDVVEESAERITQCSSKRSTCSRDRPATFKKRCRLSNSKFSLKRPSDY